MADRSGYIGRAPGDSSVVVARQTFSPTGIQTDFTFASGYVVGYLDLYLNGARLIEGQDFTATDGSVVGLTTYAQNGDVLELVAYKAFNATNVQSAGGDFSVGGNLSVTGTSALTGNATVGSAITMYASAGIVSATQFFADGVLINPGAAGTWASYDSNTGISTTKKVKIENNLEVTGAGSTFSGNLTVGGVLTYDDVTNVDSIGIITARSDISIADKIIHTGDTNTAIRFPANDTFTVETAGTERLRITGIGGSVGIGTSIPFHRFHIEEPTGENNTNALVKFRKGHTQTSVTGSTGGSNQYPHALCLENQDTSANTGTVSLVFSKLSSGAQSQAIVAGIQESAGNMALTLNTESSNIIGERLRITSSGNVGINSTSPAYLLDIASSSASMRLNSTATSTLVITSGASNAARIEFGDLANNDTGYIYYDNSDDSMQFATNGSNERLRIDSSGHVIINNPTSGGLYFKGIDTNGDEKILIGYETGSIVRIAEALRMDFSASALEPVTDNATDLGQADKRWRNIYSADLQLSNEGSSNDVDGTWGQYTIQEGENDLFLLNRRNGKKFKFMLQEVN
jgi:hypothetical protein